MRHRSRSARSAAWAAQPREDRPAQRPSRRLQVESLTCPPTRQHIRPAVGRDQESGRTEFFAATSGYWWMAMASFASTAAAKAPRPIRPDDNEADRIAMRGTGAGADGMVYPRERHRQGRCIAAFRPDVVGVPAEGDHLRCYWDGRRIAYARKPSGNRAIWALSPPPASLPPALTSQPKERGVRGNHLPAVLPACRWYRPAWTGEGRG